MGQLFSKFVFLIGMLVKEAINEGVLLVVNMIAPPIAQYMQHVIQAC